MIRLFNPYKEREIISPGSYKIHRRFLLEVFVSECEYFGCGLKDPSSGNGVGQLFITSSKQLAIMKEIAKAGLWAGFD